MFFNKIYKISAIFSLILVLFASGYCFYLHKELHQTQKELIQAHEIMLTLAKSSKNINSRQKEILKFLQNHEKRLVATENTVLGITLFLSTN